MARYRLMLLEGVPEGHRAIVEVTRAPPEGVDPAVLRSVLGSPVTGPVMLASGDDFDALQRCNAQLQQAGLEVCIFDDSTAWIRVTETLRTALGFTRVKAVGAPVERVTAASAPAPLKADAGPRVVDPNDGLWKRVVILAAALALPMVGALLLSGVFDSALYGEEPTPAASGAGPESGASGGRRLSMRAGAGQGDARDPAAGGARGGGGPAATASGGGGDQAELTQEASDPAGSSAVPPPRRTARKAIAAVLALLLGLGSAASLGELVERTTRSRTPAVRRRIRRGVALAAGLGLVVAPVVVWQAWAASRAPAAAAPAPVTVAPRSRAPAASEARCEGGPFSRFVCRSRRGARPLEPRPFASLLTRFRRQGRRPADAGVDSGVTVADVAAASHPRRESRHHRRRHREREEPAVVAATDASAGVDAVAEAAPLAPVATTDVPVAQPPPAAPPEVVTATAAPSPETAQPAVLDGPPQPPPSPPRSRGLPRGWFGGWFLAGLMAGLLAAPGWRRLGRS